MTIKSILIGTDFSKPADRLLDCVVDLKKLGLERIHLANIINLSEIGEIPVDIKENVNYSKIENYEIQGGSRNFLDATSNVVEKLNRIKKRLEAYDFKVFNHVEVGHTATKLCQIAKDEKVSLIIVGSRGESFIREAFLGSVPSDLIRICNTPTLIGKYKLSEDKIGDNVSLVCTKKFDKILLPYDFSPNADKVIMYFKDIANKIEKFVIVNIVDKGDSDQKIEEYKTKAKKRLEEISKEFADKGISTKVIVKAGIPSKEITKIAEDENVTLIGMSTKGAGLMKELVLGSTTEAVVRRSKKPIIVFPFRNSTI